MPKPLNPLHRPILAPPMLASLLGAGLILLALGCGQEPVAHYRVPKEAPASHPDHPGHDQEAMPAPAMDNAPAQAAASNLPEPPRPSAKGSLKWSLPKGWSQVNGEGMRYATFKTPVSGRLEATVVVLPGPAGGELANVNRWRSQIALGPLDEAGLAKARTVLKTKAGAVNAYDFLSDGQTKSRLVAGYISTPDGNTWFLKMTGDEAPVAKAKPDFMSLLGSLHLD